jgi:hypothetical protein
MTNAARIGCDARSCARGCGPKHARPSIDAYVGSSRGRGSRGLPGRAHYFANVTRPVARAAPARRSTR